MGANRRTQSSLAYFLLYMINIFSRFSAARFCGKNPIAFLQVFHSCLCWHPAIIGFWHFGGHLNSTIHSVALPGRVLWSSMQSTHRYLLISLSGGTFPQLPAEHDVVCVSRKHQPYLNCFFSTQRVPQNFCLTAGLLLMNTLKKPHQNKFVYLLEKSLPKILVL